jgi:hypothetical protein
MADNTTAAERSPIQNLLDEVDEFEFTVALVDEQGPLLVAQVPINDEDKIMIKDMIRSAYATGKLSA